jgi:uncharacterized protein GlcG (DUF336 family)
MNRNALMLATLSLATVAIAQAPVPDRPASPPPARGPALAPALEAARAAIDACTALEQKVSVSIVDSAGVLKVVLATDGASARGVQSSTNKAVTALTFKAATSQLGEKAKTDKEFADKIAANTSFNSRAGGVPITVNGEIIGAIGVGGARGSEKDEACAVAGIEKVKDKL